ncbi:MBL fold metallo-hydrolase [Patescibacteria group bacterium]|nr:MBL fold metallo-hydrolase [Patescibacteria group bacterium]
MRVKRTALFLSLFLLGLANLYLWGAVFNLDGNLRVSFFDVGQGDAIFIETPKGHQILIDGGSGKKVLEKLAWNLPFWDRTLDLVILTHPEKDHLGGLIWVFNRYKVANILWTGVLRETKVFEEWQEKLEKEGARKVIARAGQKIKAENVQIFILYPLESLEGKFFEASSNDTSVISQVFFGENSFLFTGDITTKIEKELLEKEVDLSSDVLKVAHHGSKTSTSEEFLEKVTPEIAVISCGKNNPYGHPHQQVLRNLEEFAIKVLRTDQDGNIKIVSNGNKFYERHSISNF